MKNRINKSHRDIVVNGEPWRVTMNGGTISFRKRRERKVYTLSLTDLCESATGQLHMSLT